MFNYWKKGEIKKAMKINFFISSLNKSLFLETSPAPVKFALSLMKRCENVLRLPLVGIKNDTKKIIKKELEQLDLLV